MTELCKAQCQQSFTGNHQTDELIQKIDQAGKLSELPEKAFDNLMNYRGKQLNFNEKTIESLKKIEKKATLTEQEKSSLAYEIASNPHHISQLPQESKKNVDETFSNKNEEMKKFFELIEPEKLSSHVKSELPIYEQLLSRIENGQKPSDHELQKLDILHDELVRYNMLDAMPNRAQSFLEIHQTKQEVQKAPAGKQVNDILEKIFNSNSSVKLEPMEAVYLNIYLNRHGATIPHNINRQIRNQLATDFQDIYQTARTEFIDPESLTVIDQVVDQISREEYRLSGNGVDIPEIGMNIKQTSEFMEIRFTDKSSQIKATLNLTDKEDFKDLITKPEHSFWQGLDFRTHKGVDFSTYGDNDGTVKYQYGFTSKPEIVQVLSVANSSTYNNYLEKNLPTKDITILEYHPEHGVLLTTFRHLQNTPYKVGKGNMLTLDAGAELGSYQLNKIDKPEGQKDKNIKEHIHIERKHADSNSLRNFINHKAELDLNTFIKVHNDTQSTKDINDDVVQLVQPMIDGNDYHAIALFTPNSPLNQKLLANFKQHWRDYNHDLIAAGKLNLQSGKKENNIQLIVDYINASALRDQLKLEVINKMLIKLQLFLTHFGDTNSKLDSLIQKTQQTAIKLREQHVPEKFKIIS